MPLPPNLHQHACMHRDMLHFQHTPSFSIISPYPAPPVCSIWETDSLQFPPVCGVFPSTSVVLCSLFPAVFGVVVANCSRRRSSSSSSTADMRGETQLPPTRTTGPLGVEKQCTSELTGSTCSRGDPTSCRPMLGDKGKPDVSARFLPFSFNFWPPKVRPYRRLHKIPRPLDRFSKLYNSVRKAARGAENGGVKNRLFERDLSETVRLMSASSSSWSKRALKIDPGCVCCLVQPTVNKCHSLFLSPRHDVWHGRKGPAVSVRANFTVQ